MNPVTRWGILWIWRKICSATNTVKGTWYNKGLVQKQMPLMLFGFSHGARRLFVPSIDFFLCYCLSCCGHLCHCLLHHHHPLPFSFFSLFRLSSSPSSSLSFFFLLLPLYPSFSLPSFLPSSLLFIFLFLLFFFSLPLAVLGTRASYPLKLLILLPWSP